MFLWILFISFFISRIVTSSDTECPTVTNPGMDRRQDKTKLRLVQYNVEWLFVDYYPNFGCPGESCPWTNTSEAEIHLSYVAKVIHDLQPDIINLCEVEGCDELNMLVDSLQDDTYKPYLKKGTDTGTGQNVGMLTRIDPSITSLYRNESRYTYPIEGSTCGYTGTSTDTGVSKHYITEFILNGFPVAFISAHLIAIPTDPTRCAQREGQAKVLESIISDFIQRDYEVIVIGDFNDYDGETPDLNGNMPLSQVLKILKTGQQLFTVAETIVKEERFTEWWDSDGDCNTTSMMDFSMIDHVLVTENLKHMIVNTTIYHGYPEYCGTYNSDHYPVVVDFQFL